MPKFNQTLTTGGFFEVDGMPYQKGDYKAIFNTDDETLAIEPASKDVERILNLRIAPTLFSDWTNNSNAAYGTYAALVTDIKAAFYKS
jgi:hypothetical protein